MKKLKTMTHLGVLLTSSSLFAYPQNHVPHVVTQTVSSWGNWWWGDQNKTEEWIRPTTYDEIMQMLKDLESGELEKRYPPEQLERVNDYLTTLAKEGTLPDEFEEDCELEEDIYDLMYGEDSIFQLTRYLENSNEYMIIPAVFNGYSAYNIVQCGKISKAWKKTKKFVKKHKKAIIVGAVVVVAVTVVAVAVVAASSASAASAVAGITGAAAGAGVSDSGHSESKKSEPEGEAISILDIPEQQMSSVDTNEAPIMKAVIDEHITSFKEFLVEDKASQQAVLPNGLDEASFGEKAREVGANVAHEALDAVTDFAKVVPQLCEEIKELSSKLLPYSLKPSNSEDTNNPIENYKGLVAKGHEAIDNVFSTDQAELFTEEANVNDPMNDFAIGTLPSPLSGSFTKMFSNTNRFKEAGKVWDRKGFTRAGRGLMKHGNREGSVFPKPLGNTAEMNNRGQVILEEILNDPKNKVYQFPDGSLKVYSPNGRGVSYNKDGSFKGFIEWQYE